MSEHQQFLQEQEQIDDLLQKGYKIKNVNESLDGDIVRFEKSSHLEEEKIEETLLLLTPKARKYYSVKLSQQAQENGQI